MGKTIAINLLCRHLFIHHHLRRFLVVVRPSVSVSIAWLHAFRWAAFRLFRTMEWMRLRCLGCLSSSATKIFLLRRWWSSESGWRRWETPGRRRTRNQRSEHRHQRANFDFQIVEHGTHLLALLKARNVSVFRDVPNFVECGQCIAGQICGHQIVIVLASLLVFFHKFFISSLYAVCVRPFFQCVLQLRFRYAAILHHQTHVLRVRLLTYVHQIFRRWSRRREWHWWTAVVWRRRRPKWWRRWWWTKMWMWHAIGECGKKANGSGKNGENRQRQHCFVVCYFC